MIGFIKEEAGWTVAFRSHTVGDDMRSWLLQFL